MTPPDATPAEPQGAFARAVLRLAHSVADADPGDLAELRRMDLDARPDEPSPLPAAFWRRLHACDLREAVGDVDGWARVALALALLTSTGRDSEKAPPHDPEARIGRVMAEVGISEPRVMRLLAATPERRREALTRLCRRIARAHPRMNLVALARLLMFDDARARRRLADDYYAALDRREREKTKDPADA